MQAYFKNPPERVYNLGCFQHIIIWDTLISLTPWVLSVYHAAFYNLPDQAALTGMWNQQAVYKLVLYTVMLPSSGDFTKCTGQWLSGVSDRIECSNKNKKHVVMTHQYNQIKINYNYDVWFTEMQINTKIALTDSQSVKMIINTVM